MDMSLWSKPFGRFNGVLFAISVTIIAMLVIYAVVAIGFLDGRYTGEVLR